MPAYAGYKGLADYIDQQLHRASIAQRRKLTRHSLSIELGRSGNYIHGLCHGQFKPSPNMAREIAACLVGESDARELAGAARTIGILAGTLDLPPDAEAQALADRIMALPRRRRESAAAFVEFLASQK